MDAKCDGCGEKVDRLLYLGGKWYGPCCQATISRPQMRGIAGYTRVIVGNKHYPSMTHAMKQNLTTRRVRADGRIAPDSRWK